MFLIVACHPGHIFSCL
uniref:Uncharacterized protein n=1 Tax=Anguilla anguilla TaxID=7936 RepID=A0A0E9SZX5_ANGAN